MSAVQSVIKIAQQAFANSSLSSENFQRLCSSIAKIKSSDLNYDIKCINHPSSQAPVLYTPVYEDNRLTASVFSIRENEKIPFHDHPNMHGLIKVIEGCVLIKSFSFLPKNVKCDPPQSLINQFSERYRKYLIPTIEQSDKLVSRDEEVFSLLTPQDCNIHEISAINGDAAFFDILSPPYPENNELYSFKKLGTFHDQDLQKDITWLIKTEKPNEFYTDYLPYQGPPIDSGRSNLSKFINQFMSS